MTREDSDTAQTCLRRYLIFLKFEASELRSQTSSVARTLAC